MLGFLYLLAFSLGLTALLVGGGLLSGMTRGPAAGRGAGRSGSSGPAGVLLLAMAEYYLVKMGALRCETVAVPAAAVIGMATFWSARATAQDSGHRSGDSGTRRSRQGSRRQPVDLGATDWDEAVPARVLGHLVRACARRCCRPCAPPRRNSAIGSSSSASTSQSTRPQSGSASTSRRISHRSEPCTTTRASARGPTRPRRRPTSSSSIGKEGWPTPAPGSTQDLAAALRTVTAP